MSCGVLWAASGPCSCGYALPVDPSAAAESTCVYRFLLFVNPASNGDGLAPIEEAAPQQNLPLELVGSRRSPAHLGRHFRQNQTSQVVAFLNDTLGDSQGRRKPP